MRLLFNQNLSVRLVRSLTDVYPGSSHVSLVGLDRASDAEVFDYFAELALKHAALLPRWCG
jgi:predicted nuclease of predicted toxin-antitoxin system